jgi:hypothetical protein
MRAPASLFQRLVTATLVAAGFGVVWGVGAQWAQESARSAGRDQLYEELCVEADGTPVVERLEWHRDFLVIPPEGQFRDLHGNSVTVPEDTRWLNGAALPAGVREGWLGPFLSPDESWDWRIRDFQDERYPFIRWFFVCDGRRHGSAYLVGYDRRDAKRIGYLGTNGFRADALPPEERFPFCGTDRGSYFRVLTPNDYRYGPRVPYNFTADGRVASSPWQLYIQGDNDTIYQVRLGERAVTAAYKGEPVRSVSLLLRSAPPDQPRRKALVVRTADAVLVLGDGNEVVRRCRVPDELRERDFSWVELPDGLALASWANWDDDQSGVVRYRLYWFDDEGRVSRRDEADLRRGRTSNNRVFMAATFPEPLVADLLGLPARALQLRYTRKAATFTEAFGQALAEFWPPLLAVQVVSVVLAGLAYCRQVRYRTGRAERLAWPLFILLLGVPAWLAYRFGLSWPILERCPACAAPVPINRERCPACQAEAPAPAPKGTDIFA